MEVIGQYSPLPNALYYILNSSILIGNRKRALPCRQVWEIQLQMDFVFVF